MHAREASLVTSAFQRLRKIPGLHILADEAEDRLGVFSFYLDGVHHNLLVRLLNDRYGIQVRGGCSCAGTYGHYLLEVNKVLSKKITDAVDRGDLRLKPGWIRLSLHPTMTDQELDYILDAIEEVSRDIKQLEKDSTYSGDLNEFFHRSVPPKKARDFASWFEWE